MTRHILVKTEEKPEQILSKTKSGKDFSKATMERSQDDRTRQMGEELLRFRLPHADNVPAE
jgi:parvulin-like peptidyl-prolyl isomerase